MADIVDVEPIIVNEEQDKARVVLILTPSLDGKVDVRYADSLARSMVECARAGIMLVPVFIAHDALIQRARNDLFKIAYDSNADDVVFIDADMGWEPAQLISILSHKVDVVGASARKKTTNEEYVVRVLQGQTKLKVNRDNLVEVSGLGTGFLRITRKIVQEIFESSKEYSQGPVKARMVFDIQIAEDGELLSEDIVLSLKIRELGHSIYLDPFITCSHTGPITFNGDLIQWARSNNLVEFE